MVPRTSAQRMVCVAICFFAFAQPLLSKPRYQNLHELYRAKKFFELRDELARHEGETSAELTFFRGAIDNKFNRSQSSIDYLNRFLQQNGTRNNDLRIESLELLADNYRKTFRYRQAVEVYQLLLKKFATRLSLKKAQNYRNELRLWRSLSAVAPQTTTFEGDSVIDQDHDGNFPLEINNHRVALGFDSGANLSVITESQARKLSLRIIDAQIDVGAIAGNKVTARVAVAAETRIGQVTIRNAVFLVFADKDLYIEQAKFQIDGVIGFPVLASLRQVAFVRGRGVIIPAKANVSGAQNFCLDGFSPVIAGWFKQDRLSFILDTGATSSTLYPPFFHRYEAEVKAQNAAGQNERLIGAGGSREVMSYLGKSVTLAFSDKQASFAKIPILTEYTTDTSRYFYGNLGQDLVRQFERMTINFEKMSVVFE